MVERIGGCRYDVVRLPAGRSLHVGILSLGRSLLRRTSVGVRGV